METAKAWDLPQYIEHTQLSPLIRAEEVEKLVAEAKACQFAGVCVPPYWAKKARRDLGDSPVQLVTVIGFPLGYQRSEVKVQEVLSAQREGVQEFDVMLNLSALKNEAYHWIKIEMAQLSQIIHEKEGLLKVIIETAYLNEAEMEKVCQVCVDAGVDFIKTSSGYASEGATEEKVRFLRQILPVQIGLKASGGIRTWAQARALLEAGADRLGTSQALAIMAAWKDETSE
ncbi:MAG: deoxyribose-phosphate aldolase [Microscillaceae bacterium]|nr:deoxyribose-phosphate aldolase [Microscillaceae bacterium]